MAFNKLNKEIGEKRKVQPCGAASTTLCLSAAPICTAVQAGENTDELQAKSKEMKQVHTCRISLSVCSLPRGRCCWAPHSTHVSLPVL